MCNKLTAKTFERMGIFQYGFQQNSPFSIMSLIKNISDFMLFDRLRNLRTGKVPKLDQAEIFGRNGLAFMCRKFYISGQTFLHAFWKSPGPAARVELFWR